MKQQPADHLPADPSLLSFCGRSFPTDPTRFGPLRDSSDLIADPEALQARFHTDGYLFLPSLHEPNVVLAARRELLLKFAIIGEIDDRHPLKDGIEGDRAGLPYVNMRAFTQSVSSGAAYENLILHQNIVRVVGDILGAPVRAFDFRWPRLVRHGENCGYHCDGPYMLRGTDRLLTVWTPMGDIKPHEGGLMVLENSHKNAALRNGYLEKDADRDSLRWLDADPVGIQDSFGSRWLTATYKPGDVLIFGMKTLHGAFDNRSPERRCRLSCDTRFMVDGEDVDGRWNGNNMAPHGPGRVFYPGLGSWENKDFQDEWKYVDERGRLQL